MQASAEISIDLDATELLSPPAPTGTIEVEDFGALEASLGAGTHAAQEEAKPSASGARAEGELEIELTPEQIDELLSGFDPFR